jgi:hypothetical protein
MLVNLPTTINVSNARLPEAYEHAKTALANCASIDECQEWANKAEALASYAKQADDDTLRKLADRIQARAVRRCGELLKQFDARPNNASNQSVGTDTLISRQDAARNAGLSDRQRVTAVRVANVPADDFDRAVDSPTPPTVTKLADMGRKSREPAWKPTDIPAPLKETPPAGFAQATHLIGAMKRYAEHCKDPVLLAKALMPAERAEVRRLVAQIDAFHDQFIVNIEG